MNNEQEIIDKYLQANPLSKSDKKKNKMWYPRCIACNSRVNVTKKKPLTTYAGSMNSVYTDKVHNFPKHEDEDLCVRCQEKIRNSNADKNDQFDYDNNYTYRNAENYTDSLDARALETENEYQGYGSYDMLEGTGYTLPERDGEL